MNDGLDMRSFTVGPGTGERLHRPPYRRGRRLRRGWSGAARRSRAMSPTGCLQAIEQLGVQIEAILITHCHFDHIGAVAPLARATGAPVYCPEIERPVLEDIALGTPPGFGPFESYEPEHTLSGGESLNLAGLDIEVLFTPGHSPGHLTFRHARTRRDPLWRRPVPGLGRPRRPALRRPRHAGALVGDLDRYAPPRDDRLSGSHGDHDARARAGHQPVPRRASRRHAARSPGRRQPELSDAGKIKAPRGTFDVLGEQSAARATLEARARAILEGAGYERIETPAFEATELFARGVGASTDIVQKEMFTFEDASGRSLTLRPEGTAPVCRAYVEHGMHKRRQPVKLWYLSSFFRHERAQAGRYRQFWQVGAEALGSEDPAVDAESILLLATLLEEMGVASVRLRLSSLGSPAARQEYREQLQAHLRAHADALSEDVRARIELNPLRAFDSDHPGTRAVMQSAPLLREFLDERDAEHFAEVRSSPGRRRSRLRARPHARARPGLLHAHGVRAHLRCPRRAERRRRRRSLRRPGGDARRTADPGHRLGRRNRAHPARGRCATPRRPRRSICSSLTSQSERCRRGRRYGYAFQGRDPQTRTHTRADAFALLSEARAAGLTAQMELAGRSLKGQLGFANTLGARYVAILRATAMRLR